MFIHTHCAWWNMKQASTTWPSPAVGYTRCRSNFSHKDRLSALRALRLSSKTARNAQIPVKLIPTYFQSSKQLLTARTCNDLWRLTRLRLNLHERSRRRAYAVCTTCKLVTMWWIYQIALVQGSLKSASDNVFELRVQRDRKPSFRASDEFIVRTRSAGVGLTTSVVRSWFPSPSETHFLVVLHAQMTSVPPCVIHVAL